MEVVIRRIRKVLEARRRDTDAETGRVVGRSEAQHT